MKITREQFEEIIFDWESITEEKISHQSRWLTYYNQVFKNPEDGTFWCLDWARGSTEMQDSDDQPIFKNEVFPIVVPTTLYLTQTEIDSIGK